MKKLFAVFLLLGLNVFILLGMKYFPLPQLAQATVPISGSYVLPFHQPFYTTGVAIMAGYQSLGNELSPLVLDMNGDGLLDAVYQSKHEGMLYSGGSFPTWNQRVWVNDGGALLELVNCTYSSRQEYDSRCAV